MKETKILLTERPSIEPFKRQSPTMRRYQLNDTFNKAQKLSNLREVLSNERSRSKAGKGSICPSFATSSRLQRAKSTNLLTCRSSTNLLQPFPNIVNMESHYRQLQQILNQQNQTLIAQNNFLKEQVNKLYERESVLNEKVKRYKKQMKLMKLQKQMVEKKYSEIKEYVNEVVSKIQKLTLGNFQKELLKMLKIKFINEMHDERQNFNTYQQQMIKKKGIQVSYDYESSQSLKNHMKQRFFSLNQILPRLSEENSDNFKLGDLSYSHFLESDILANKKDQQNSQEGINVTSNLLLQAPLNPSLKGQRSPSFNPSQIKLNEMNKIAPSTQSTFSPPQSHTSDHSPHKNLQCYSSKTYNQSEDIRKVNVSSSSEDQEDNSEIDQKKFDEQYIPNSKRNQAYRQQYMSQRKINKSQLDDSQMIDQKVQMVEKLIRQLKDKVTAKR